MSILVGARNSVVRNISSTKPVSVHVPPAGWLTVRVARRRRIGDRNSAHVLLHLQLILHPSPFAAATFDNGEDNAGNGEDDDDNDGCDYATPDSSGLVPGVLVVVVEVACRK